MPKKNEHPFNGTSIGFPYDKKYNKPSDVPDDGAVYEWNFNHSNGGLPLINKNLSGYSMLTKTEDAEFEVISSKLKS